ncbi:pyridoxal phosphate-dependent aminotransferase [Mogibacterium diversum]|uniref:pyridoxal phosphate-dependent aminotransferase n=1 Tax=Mogibacterium diversum TaxID=114527 RepID=UPI001CAB2E36|nr:pyridoxal phosphate-dependent aminotransferase [Mogibacterium diversum]MBF1319551.1 pyridoxal phosphate-dependent aminotransferase [Mogibacterium diversum]MBF1359166.1 pyridoxal phosphate-dependent aminotransferase [Mogibacterium diversum]
MKLSRNSQAMEFSPIRKFNPIATEVQESGVKIYHLNIGQPDIKTPRCFMDAVRAFDEDVLMYEQSQGDIKFLESICDYYKREYGVGYKPTDIVVTMGASEALTMTFTTIIDPGDEILIAEPFYSNYQTFALVRGGDIRPIPTSSKEGYRYAAKDKLEAALTDKTKAIVCINPGNPTGLALTAEEMDVIADFVIENDLWLIADEAYREYVYDGIKPRSFANIDRLKENLIVIDSVSKRYSACGARIGFVASKNEEFMTGIIKLAQSRLCVSTLEQIGSTELFKLPSSYYEEMKEEYCKRRDAAYEEIMQIPDVICHKPGGAFYMMVDLPIDDAEDFLMFLLTEYRDNNETVMFAPAAGFYSTPGKGRSEIRIAYVLESGYIKRACQLIRTGLEAYKAKMSK